MVGMMEDLLIIRSLTKVRTVFNLMMVLEEKVRRCNEMR